MRNEITMKTKTKKNIFNQKNEEVFVPVWTPDDFLINDHSTPFAAIAAYKFNGDLKNGTYIEIGAGHYKHQNNTYLLETEHAWKGVSIDISDILTNDFNSNRINPCIMSDAITFDWSKYLIENNFPAVIDFLSIDIDFETHESANLLALINLPLTQYKFNIISIEHMASMFYKFKKLRDIQRDILTMLGYHLLIPGKNEDLWTIQEPNSANGFDHISGMFGIGV
jgi:hypothetical protein